MVHKTSLTPPPFIGVPVTSQEGERAYMCVCVEGVDFASVFLHFFCWIVELFRQCGFFCFLNLNFGVQRHFQQYFSYIMATSFSGGRNRSTRKEPPIMGKQLVSFIICGCESSAPFFLIVFYKTGRETTPYW